MRTGSGAGRVLVLMWGGLALSGMALVACAGAISDSDEVSADDDEPNPGEAGSGGPASEGGRAGQSGSGGTGGVFVPAPLGGSGGGSNPTQGGGKAGAGGGGVVAMGGQGGAPSGGATQPPPQPPPSGSQGRAVIAVGYGGLRMFSTDGGRTWGKRVVLDPNGGDDRNLLRGAGYGDGVWVAVGWKIFTSEDGKTWTEIHDDVVPGSWYDCVNYKDGKFIVQRIRDGYSDHLVSMDRGKTWQKGTGSARCEGLAKGDAKPVFKTDAGSLSTGWRGKITLDDKTIYTDSCCHVRNFEQGFLPAD